MLTVVSPTGLGLSGWAGTISTTMTEPATFYVTTPIYYVNDKPHLGHVYTTMVADVVARYHRLRGDDTFFLTGVDEHAAKVADRAADNGMTPQGWADRNAAEFKQVFERLEMTHDDFVRTSSDLHKAKVTEYVTALLESGDVYEGEYEGWYDAGQEEYIPENKAKANDYQSEVNGRPLVKKTEKNYFFKLASYREAVAGAIRSGAFDVQPEARRNEILNRLAEANDVPISRSGSGGWGIPVPGDPEQTVYVWIDALFNYLTYMDTPDRRKYWQAGAVHFIAKDILWFHAAIWPALLLALRQCAGFEWVNLPRMVYCHSYWISESGEKMSKSLGNFLDPAAIDNYVNEFGLDALRYFLATRGPLGTTDSAFSPDLFVEVYNSDLANTFGNSCSRVTNMIGKYFDGLLPEVPPVDFDRDWATAINGMTLHQFSDLMVKEYPQRASILDLGGTSFRPLEIIKQVDSSIEIHKPFTKAKNTENMPQVGEILASCLEALRIASVLLWPFIPDACEAFWKRIGCEQYATELAAGRGTLDEWTKWGQLAPGSRIEKGAALFPRYEAK